MRAFAQELKEKGHSVKYISILDSENLHSIEKNIQSLISGHGFCRFEYQQPDEYRLQELLANLHLSIPKFKTDTEHFYTTTDELSIFSKEKTTTHGDFLSIHAKKT